MPLSVSVTVGDHQLVTMEKCVHAHLTYPTWLAAVPGFLKMARNLQTSASCLGGNVSLSEYPSVRGEGMPCL